MSQQCTEDSCMLLALVLDYSYIRCHHKKYGERLSGIWYNPPYFLCLDDCFVTKLCRTLSDSIDCRLAKLFCPWDFPGKSIGVRCRFLLQHLQLCQNKMFKKRRGNSVSHFGHFYRPLTSPGSPMVYKFQREHKLRRHTQWREDLGLVTRLLPIASYQYRVLFLKIDLI